MAEYIHGICQENFGPFGYLDLTKIFFKPIDDQWSHLSSKHLEISKTSFGIMSSGQILNKIESLVVELSPFTHLNNHEEKEEFIQEYASFNELVHRSDNLLTIFQHKLFKDNNDTELNLRIYDLIINKAEDQSIQPQILKIMEELQATPNFVQSFKTQITKVLKFSKKIKSLRAAVDNQPQHSLVIIPSDII